jgi:hypothetical protein
MAKTLGDVRKSLKAFDALRVKERTTTKDENLVITRIDEVNREMVRNLPDETELPKDAEFHFSTIEERIQQITKIFSKKA